MTLSGKWTERAAQGSPFDSHEVSLYGKTNTDIYPGKTKKIVLKKTNNFFEYYSNGSFIRKVAQRELTNNAFYLKAWSRGDIIIIDDFKISYLNM